MAAEDEDQLLFEHEVLDFKIFHRRLPTVLEESGIWERIQDLKRRKDHEHATITEPGEIEPSP